MGYTTVQLKVTTTGSVGTATGSVRKGVPVGRLVGFQVNYHADAPATTDITLKNVLNGVERTLLTKDDNKTDIPLHAFTNNPIGSDGAQVATQHEHPPVLGELVLDVAQCDALTNAVVVTCVIRV